MSEFIERSKHPGLTAMVQAHFGGAKPDATGMAPEAVKGYNGQNALPTPQQSYPFNTPDSGVNYVAPNRAGHSIKDDPFNFYK